MVDTQVSNGAPPEAPAAAPPAPRELPEVVFITKAEAQRIPAPGTQRMLKAMTGQAWDTLVGPGSDSADRIQTLVWIHLRRQIPDLRWEECDVVGIALEEGADVVDPTSLSGSGSSPASAASGG